ncbi:hypothetical protein RB595_008982 [Gaeumannomyces hyphopodioides]
MAAAAVAAPAAAAQPAAAAADAAGPVVLAPVGQATVFSMSRPFTKADLLAIEVACTTSSRVERVQIALVIQLCCVSRREVAAWLSTYLKFRRSLPEAVVTDLLKETLGCNLLQTVAMRLFCLPNSRRGPHDRWFFTELWPRFSQSPGMGGILWEIMKRRDIVSWRMLSPEDARRPFSDLMPVKRGLVAFMAEIPYGSELAPGSDALALDIQSGAEWYFMLGFHACFDRTHRADLFDVYAELAGELRREPPRGQQHPDPDALTFRDFWAAVMRGGVVDLLERADIASYVDHLPPRFFQFMKLSFVAPKASVWRLMQVIIWVDTVAIDRRAANVHDLGSPVLAAEEDWGFKTCAPGLRNKLAKFYRRLIDRFDDPMVVERGRQSGNFLKWCEKNNGGEIRADIKLVLADIRPTPKS